MVPGKNDRIFRISFAWPLMDKILLSFTIEIAKTQLKVNSFVKRLSYRHGQFDKGFEMQHPVRDKLMCVLWYHVLHTCNISI